MNRKKEKLDILTKLVSKAFLFLDKISNRLGGAPIAVRAMTIVAETYEKKERFENAFQQWSVISAVALTGQVAKDALLGMARCKHAAYKNSALDVSNLLTAKFYYERFKMLYPADASALNIDRRLHLIEEQIAYNQCHIASFRQKFRQKNPHAAGTVV